MFILPFSIFFLRFLSLYFLLLAALCFIFFRLFFSLACFSSPCSQLLALLKHADKRGLCVAAGHHVYVRYLCTSSLSLNMQYSKAEKVFEQRWLNLGINYPNQTNRYLWLFNEVHGFQYVWYKTI